MFASVRPSVSPSVRCQHNVLVCPSVRHNVRLCVRPLVRPCGANIIYFSKESTYLWFIYSRRCGVVCPTEVGLLHFLKGMVFQVSELSQKQLLTPLGHNPPCFLPLEGRLGSGPRLEGRIGSGVRVKAGTDDPFL